MITNPITFAMFISKRIYANIKHRIPMNYDLSDVCFLSCCFDTYDRRGWKSMVSINSTVHVLYDIFSMSIQYTPEELVLKSVNTNFRVKLNKNVQKS